jgi:hypothetical protein
MMVKECLENNPPQVEANMKAKKTFWNLGHVAKWQLATTLKHILMKKKFAVRN